MIKLIFLLSVLSAGSSKLKVDFQNSKLNHLQGQKAVSTFIQGNQVRVVYFYKREVKFLKFFFKEFEKSAEFLEMYGVKTGFCNCTDDLGKDVQECKKKDVENSVHTYRSGSHLLSLELETMFDVNSILSNILQLVMLREVPILQTLQEVERFLGTMRGSKDVVFGHMKAIGTFDHRVFMEVAYAYLNKLQFVICTDKKATQLFDQPKKTGKDISTVWWVWTKSMSPTDSSYHNIRYHGELNLKELANFVKMVTKPKMFSMPVEGLDHPFSTFEVPVVKLYYNKASEVDTYQKADMLSKYYGGHVGVVLIDMDHEDVGKVTSYQGKIPTMSFQRDAESEEQFMPDSLKWSSNSIARFMKIHLVSGLEQMVAREPRDEDIDEDRPTVQEPVEEYENSPFSYEDVEKQDDHVAEMVEKTKKIKMPLELVPALTDKTFPITVKDADTAVVLLYFPFDAVSMGNLRMFGEAADMLGKQTTLKIARVNCYDWTDVCQKEDIVIYPTLRVYKKGEKAWDYKGPQDTRAMFSMLRLLEMSPPVYETDREKLMEYLVGKGDSTLTEITNTTVVGLFRKGDKQEKDLFQQLATSSRDRIMFVYSDGKDAGIIAEKFSTSVPAVILARYDDPVQPYVTFAGKYTLENLQKFVDDNKLPKLAVLTPLVFPELRRKFSEMLILFTDGSELCQQSENTVRDIVKAQQFNNISFNMMAVTDHSGVGYRVLQQYTAEPELPHLSLVKFQKGEVFNFAAVDVDPGSVTNWLVNVVQGTIEPSTVLKDGEWKPKSKGYEFLKIIDWEAKKRKEEKGRGAPDEVPENPKGNRQMSDETAQPYSEDNEGVVTVDDGEETGTRQDLLELKDSRLYHQSPGRVHHHGDKDRGSNSVDEGYSSDEEMADEVSVGQVEKESEMKQKHHDPSEL